MTREPLKTTLDRLGLKQAELARLIGVTPRTVSQWATGSIDVPGPVAAYLRMLSAAGPEVRSRELARLEERMKSLDEGLYGLTYAGEDRGERQIGDALAVLRSGRILGSDRWGGVFTGSYSFDPVIGRNSVHVRMDVPPGGELVTGFSAGPEGAVLEIVGAFERGTPQTTAVVEIGGRPLHLTLTYIGPLPH